MSRSSSSASQSSPRKKKARRDTSSTSSASDYSPKRTERLSRKHDPKKVEPTSDTDIYRSPRRSSASSKGRQIKDEPQSPQTSRSPRKIRDDNVPRRYRRSSPRRRRSPGYGSRQQRHSRDRSPRKSPIRNRSRERRYSRSPGPCNRHRDGNGKYGIQKHDEKWGKPEHWEKKKEQQIPPEEKQQVNLQTTGKLAEDTNTFKGVIIKYSEPPEAKIPKLKWRLYPFKEDESLPTLYIHRQSAYLIGRDKLIADLHVEHPSCSKQHAVLQYRSVPYARADGTKGRAVRPYLIDLGSANGTCINGSKLEPQRYYELMDRDVIRFGFSTRDYVILSERAAETAASSDEEQKADV